MPAIGAALDDLAGWPVPEGGPYPGPALFVNGARSDYVLPEYREGIRALFPAARFVTLKDAGHWLHADDPDGFAGTVEAFIPAA